MRDPSFIAQFLRDVERHKVYVERDDGLYRHLRFRDTDEAGKTSYCMGFDIVTWPGWLAYSGDMGSFMFQRTPDMLAFFRKQERDGRTLFDSIDLRYWAEKCEAEGARGDGIKEWDQAAFRREITEQRRRMLVAFGRPWSREQREELWEDLQLVIDTQDEWDAIAKVRDWSHLDPTRRTWMHLDTDDFPDCKTYTQRFTWCCCALAWGIAQYDAHKAAAAAAASNETTTHAAPAAA